MKKLLGFAALLVIGLLGIVFIDHQSATQPDGAYGVCLAAIWGAGFVIASFYWLFKNNK
ncbi:MAG: hypothetical protein ABIJ82_03125 [Patescibacteria group bacterium]|nr:hypothetical protein [Patescibacteria group bacterium]MBU1952957.1 hypothetical protein [Patescibacteria group bacterium]